MSLATTHWPNKETPCRINLVGNLIGEPIRVLPLLFALSMVAMFGVFAGAAEVPEDPPFPFSHRSLEEEMEDSRFVEEVPIPFDTIGRPKVGPAKNKGEIYKDAERSAPKPEPILRPRYRSDATNASKSKSSGRTTPEHLRSSPALSVTTWEHHVPTGTGPKSFSTQPLPQQPIRQISVSNAVANVLPAQNESEPVQSESESESDFVPFPLPTPFPFSPYDAPRNDSGLFQSEPSTINSTHTCDELTCGGGCSSASGFGLFKHLAPNTVRRGLCDHCGLLTCSRKTTGPWYFDSWISIGSFMNTHWPENGDNRPLYYNDRNGEVVMNQLYLSFGRRVRTSGGRFDLGGKIDLLYGTDYYYTSALGLETHCTDESGQITVDPLAALGHWNSNNGLHREGALRRQGAAALNGLSMPQAYAEMYVPFGNGVTIKAGHFYSGMGIESAMSPENFFYSHSYSFMYGAPVTLTGATTTMTFGPHLSGIVGFSQGWNTWDSPTDKFAAILGVRLRSLDDRSSLSFITHSGEESLRGSDRRTNYTLAYKQRVGTRGHYALEHSLGYEKDGSLQQLIPAQRGPARWMSIAQYLQWELSEKLSVGFRAEWFRDDGHSRIQKGAVVAPSQWLSGKNYYELTLGLNWKPTHYITVRPEVRYDWSDVQVNARIPNTNTIISSGVYDSRREMVSFAVDAVLRF